jgi:hypothetical protein
MKKFLYFSTGAVDNTSSTEETIMFPAENISHFEATTATTLNIYLQSGNDQEQAADSVARANTNVRLNITSGRHKEVMEAIAEAIAPNGPTVPFIVVADTANSVFLNQYITGCGGIIVVDATGVSYSPNYQNVIVGAYSTNDITVTDLQSGSLITLPATGAASTLTLPAAPSSGANYEFVAEADGGSNTITVAGAIEGTLNINGSATKIDTATSIRIGTSKQIEGDNFKVVWTGTNWFITGTFSSASAVTAQ